MARLLCYTLVAALGAAAVPVENGNDQIPMQLHIAYAGTSGMQISWNTYGQVMEPTVHWGTSPDKLSNTACSNVSVTYQTSTTYNNHVKINGLEPDTQYYYLPQGSTNVTKPYSFTTPRTTGDHTPFTAAVIVDMGTMGGYGLTTHVGDGAANPLKKGEHNTIQSLTKTMDNWDFVWHGE